MTQQKIESCCTDPDANLMEVLVRSVVDLSFAQTWVQLTSVVKTAARNLAHADGTTFVLNEGTMCYYVDEDAVSPLWKGKRFPKESCISGWAMSNKKQAVIPNIFVDERIPLSAYEQTFVKSLVMTPVRQDDPVAAIGTYWAHHHDVSEEQARCLQALADITAVAVQNIEQMQNLEHLVEQRTLELAASRDELKQLAYVVSHELQEPLRSMSSDLRLLSVRYKDRFGVEVTKLVSSAVSNGLRAERMIDGLWMYARVDRHNLIVSETSTEDAMNKALYRLSDPIEASGASITHTNLPIVTANGIQLEYLFQELIENSIKFCREKPSIHVTAQRKNEHWFFSVEDNGRGFDMIDGSVIFAMFYRLDKSVPGSGMGLAVCKRIVETHGGSLWAQSRKGEGSTFYFTLPL